MLIGKVLTATSRCLIINSILDKKIYTAAVFNRNLLVNQRTMDYWGYAYALYVLHVRPYSLHNILILL